jgi:hypothetical protein
MCSILWWIVYLRSSRLHVFDFEPWFMDWHQGGEMLVEKSCIASLESIPRVKGELVHFFCIFGFWEYAAEENRLDRFRKPVWPILEWDVEENRLDLFWKLVWPVLAAEHAPGECALVQGEYAYVQGELLYALVVCALCLSIVLPRMCQAVALA